MVKTGTGRPESPRHVPIGDLFGAEPLPARWSPDANRVIFVVGAQVPSDIEALIGAPITWPGKIPNAYFTVEDGELSRVGRPQLPQRQSVS